MDKRRFKIIVKGLEDVKNRFPETKRRYEGEYI